VISAILTAALGIVHSVLGERRLIGPLLAPGERTGLLAKRFARNILRFAWHLTSIAWWGLAAVLAGADSRSAVLVAVAATLALSGLVVLYSSRGRHLAWPVFLAAAALALLPVFG
jgi:hypothetical protein